MRALINCEKFRRVPPRGSLLPKFSQVTLATGEALKSAVRPAEGRPEDRFGCPPGSGLAKILPGRPIYSPEALSRDMQYVWAQHAMKPTCRTHKSLAKLSMASPHLSPGVVVPPTCSEKGSDNVRNWWGLLHNTSPEVVVAPKMFGERSDNVRNCRVPLPHPCPGWWFPANVRKMIGTAGGTLPCIRKHGTRQQ